MVTIRFANATTGSDPQQEACSSNLTADIRILGYDFNDDELDEADSDFVVDDITESESDTAWFDELPNDDVFVSEADFPIMYLNKKEREIFFFYFINNGDQRRSQPTLKGLNRLKVVHYLTEHLLGSGPGGPTG